MSEDGFLKRWSLRKSQAHGNERAQPQTKTQVQAQVQVQVQAPLGNSNQELKSGAQLGSPQSEFTSRESLSLSSAPVDSGLKPHQKALEPPSQLPDPSELTPDSDFRPFMNAKVLPHVKNAALKTLFKDPHFNVMDRMDIYIDDYSIPDPITAEEIANMASRAFLDTPNWEEEKQNPKASEVLGLEPYPSSQEGSVIENSQVMSQVQLPVTSEDVPSPEGEEAKVQGDDQGTAEKAVKTQSGVSK